MSGERVFVFGAGGHGKVVADAALSSGWEVVAFIDDSPGIVGGTIWGRSVIGFEDFIVQQAKWPSAGVVLGVGNNAARERCNTRLRGENARVLSVVHRAAVVAPTASLAPGTVVLAGAVVNPDAVVGAGCIINTGAVVEHDCVLGAYVHLSPNAALGGGVRIGDRTHVGLGAVVLPTVHVGADVVVGAGAVVIREAFSATTLVGVPARPIMKGATP
jgi:sugar O-acyltransferase (sialic acid O-acetyltransferase NeuD family)